MVLQDESEAQSPDEKARDSHGRGSGSEPASTERQIEGGGAMSRPVEVTPQATGTLGRTAERVRAVETAPALGADAEAPAGPSRRAVVVRIMRRAAAILARVLRAVFVLLLRLFQQNPRAS